MRTKQDLIQMQSVPLEVKILMTQRRIREWVHEFGVDGVYVSFSGGKDSTVLLHLVRELYPDVEAVFVNTGLEYPEIQRFVRSFDNVKILYPEMHFNEVISTYGYPLISKEISKVVREARQNVRLGKTDKYTYSLKKLNGDRLDKEGNKSRYNCEKYKPLLNVDFECSPKCCDIMKKNPAKKYEKESGKVPILATMASESRLREQKWVQEGCNAFDVKRPSSKPMSFWTEQDVLGYCKMKDIKLASVYGDIVPEDGQMNLFEDENPCKLCTTGADRTGCIFCGFGAQLDKGEGRFERLKRTHPKQYAYCMNGGDYDSEGIWKPNKNGLGMAHVIDELNKLFSKNGKPFIKY